MKQNTYKTKAREILKRKNCGKDITGLQVVFVTAIKDTGKMDFYMGKKSPVWLWQCVCGNTFEMSIARMKNKKLPSCGCKTLELRRKIIKEATKKLPYYKGTMISTLLRDNAKARNKLGIIGVYQHNKTGRYFMRIRVAGKQYHKGYFDTIEEAVKARKEAVKKYHYPLVKEYEKLMLRKKKK